MRIKAALVAPGTHIPSQSEFNAFMRVRRGDLAKLAERLVAGTLSPDEWYDAFASMLIDGHAGAYALGRQRGGDMWPLDVDDYLRGRAIADGETQWLLGFLDDLRNKHPRYFDAETGVYRLSTIQQRSGLYAAKMRGTSSAAFVGTADVLEQFEWVLGAVEEHCSQCPVLAGMSPWDADAMPFYPGSADTPCLGNCKCHLVRLSDGLSSFKPL